MFTFCDIDPACSEFLHGAMMEHLSMFTAGYKVVYCHR